MNAVQSISILTNRPVEAISSVEHWMSVLLVKFVKGSNRFVSLKKFISLAASEPKGFILTVPAGRKGATPWVAEITGLDSRYSLKREFIDGTIEWAGRKGAVKGCFTINAEGLYQAGTAGNTSDDYFVVENINGKLKFRDISWQEAKVIARDIDEAMALLA